MILSKIIIALIIVSIFFYSYRNLFRFIHYKLKNIDFHSSGTSLGTLGVLNTISFILAAFSLILTINADIIEKINVFMKNNGSSSLLLFFITIFFLVLIIHNKSEEILSLKRELSNETKGIWRSITDLSVFYTDKVEKKLLTNFLNTHSHVISIQRYRYRFEKQAHFLKLIIYGEKSFVREEEDLNLIAQAYFSFQLKDLNDMLSALDDATSNTHLIENTTNVKPLIRKYIELLERVNKNDELSNEQTIAFELSEVIRPEIEDLLDAHLPPEIEEDTLIKLKQKKSGMQIAIFLLKHYLHITSNQISTFEYNGSSDDKKNRLYSNVQLVTLNGEKFVYILTHDPDENWTMEARKDKLKEDTFEFVELLQKESKFKH